MARYVGATAVAAALAYAIGLVPMLLGERLHALDRPVLGVLGLVLGGALLATIGTAQWWVLRPLLPHAARWIPASALAWLLGLGAFVAVSTPLWRTGQPVVAVVAIGVLGGLVMAAVVAAVTGAALPLLGGPVGLLVRRPAGRPGHRDRAARRHRVRR